LKRDEVTIPPSRGHEMRISRLASGLGSHRGYQIHISRRAPTSPRSRECAAAGDIRGQSPHVVALVRATGVLAEMGEGKKKRPISSYAIALPASGRGSALRLGLAVVSTNRASRASGRPKLNRLVLQTSISARTGLAQQHRDQGGEDDPGKPERRRVFKVRDRVSVR